MLCARPPGRPLAEQPSPSPAAATAPVDDEPTVRFASKVARAGFTVAYNVVLFDRSLSVHARLLYLQLSHYAYLCEHAKRDSPEQTEIAANLGIKERAMRPYIRELEACGLVTVKARGRGLTHLYTIVEPTDENQDRQNTAGLDRQSTPPQTGKKLPVSPTTEEGKTARAKALARDVVWDKLAELFGDVGAGQSNARKKRNAAVRDLKGFGATPSSIDRVAQAYRREMPSAIMTDSALATHYPQLAHAAGLTPGDDGERVRCEDCGLGGGLHVAGCTLAEAAA